MTQEADYDEFSAIAFQARGRLFGARPGAHRSRSTGSGGAFASLVPLLDHVDPRRIDLRASIADPFDSLWVRRHRQSVAAKVIVLVDGSGSMAAEGASRRRDLVALLCAGMARAVERSGDSFGLVLAGEDPEDALMPPRQRRGIAPDVARRIERGSFRGRGIGDLIAAADRLPQSRSIVLLVSDFTDGVEDVAALLDRLSAHDVRPIVLRDSGLENPDPRFGIVDTQDLESGRRRFVLMRPSLAKRWAQTAAGHRAAIAALFAERDLTPIEIVDEIDPDALFEAFLTGGRG